MSAPGSRRIGRPPSARKHFGEQLRELFDDGTGQLHPGLAGLYGDLVSMPEPGHGRTWLRNNPTAAEYLRGLARGNIPLTHDALHDLPSWRTAAHLRDLLMASGALPRIDRQILLFERWYRLELQAVSDPGHAQLLRQFATWHLLPHMRARAGRQALGPGSRNAAANQFTLARKFLACWPAAAASSGTPPSPTSTPGTSPGPSPRPCAASGPGRWPAAGCPAWTSPGSARLGGRRSASTAAWCC